MKIVFVIHDLGLGGAQKQIVLLSDALTELGHEVSILVMRASDNQFVPNAAEIVTLDISLVAFGGLRKVLKIPSLVRTLRRAIMLREPDCVVSFMTQTSVLTGAALIGSGVRHIACERTYPSCAPFVSSYRPRWLFRCIRDHFYMRSEAVVVQSRSAADSFSRNVQQRVVVIPNIMPLIGVDDSLEPRQKRIVCFARFAPEKNHTFLLEAFCRIHRVHPEWELHLFGSGSEEIRLREFCVLHGIAGAVRFRGVTSDIFSELRPASIAVLTSHFEGFPNAIAEAMAAGIPVVAVRSPGGISDLVDHGKNGYLTEPGDLDDFVQRIETLIADSGLRERFGESATQKVEQFRGSNVSQKWLELFANN